VGYNILDMAAKKTQEEFLKQVIKLYDIPLDDFSNILWVNNKTHIELTCIKHKHTYTKIPKSYLQGNRCVKCQKDMPNGYWTEEVIGKTILGIIKPIYEKTNIIIPSSQLKNHNRSMFSTFRKIKQPHLFYLNLLKDNNLPEPNKLYYSDNEAFRGFYEFVGYCFIKSWGINITPVVKVDRYISDGYFNDIDTYWEHWGGLNKNNINKKEYYKTHNLNLIETSDDKCQKYGIEFLYNQLRDALTKHGYNIKEYDVDNVYDIINNDVKQFDGVVKEIIVYLKKNKLTKHFSENHLRNDKGNKIEHYIFKYFDGKISLLKDYLNKHHEFNFFIRAQSGSYKDTNHLIKNITPYIKEFKRVPTQTEFTNLGRNDINIIINRLLHGHETLRRNEIEEGEYYYIVKDILGDDSPYDKQLVWGKEYELTIKKIVDYYISKGIPFPRISNDLRHSNVYNPFGKQLHTQITRSNRGGWDKFVLDYEEYWSCMCELLVL
jgi:hypothetical protein